MSIEAVAWALKTTDALDATEKLVLIGIANHADHEGRGARPGQAVLARYACCSIRTVRRKLVDLEARRMIRRGDQERAAHIPANMRPVVWDVAMDWVTDPSELEPRQSDASDTAVSYQTGQDDRAVIAMTHQTGHSYDLSDRTRMSYRTIREPSDEPSELKTSAATSTFEDFYAVYPLHRERRDAARAWDKAVKRADPDVIIAGARRYAADPNRVAGYTRYPATWLNGDGWEDDPLPSREVRDRQGDILAQEFARARAVDAAEQLPGQLALGEGWR